MDHSNVLSAGPQAGTRVRLLLIMALAEYGGLDRLMGYVCGELRRRATWVQAVRVSGVAGRPPPPSAPPDLPVASITDLTREPWQRLRPRLAELMARTRFDCVVFAGSRATLLADAARAFAPGARLVSFLFNPADGLHAHRLMAPMLDAVIVENDEVAGALADAGELPGRIVEIANGTDLARFRPGTANAELAAVIGLRPGRPVVAFAGRLSPEKGPLDFVAAAAGLATRDVELLMAGTGPQADAIAAATEAAGLAGRLRRYDAAPAVMPEMLRLIDVLIVPSHIDSRPQVAMEAMATGVAVVATTVGGIPAMIADGVDGFLCPPRSPAALAEAAAALVGDPVLRARIGAAARRRALAAFDMRLSLPRLADALLGPAFT
ncbi:MAG: glycosyltransferase [Alphaproteobacteria bacterium]|nr:glycosyltransferase [Alphaproteobacteria bacterium]